LPSPRVTRVASKRPAEDSEFSSSESTNPKVLPSVVPEVITDPQGGVETLTP
jgi:hypothetical protein